VKASIGVLCCLILTGTAIFAQQGGSNYSIFGIGDIRYAMGAGYEGMAGTQIAVPSFHAINLQNPAQWSELKLTRLQAGFRFQQNEVMQSGGAKANQNNGKLDGIAIVFQVDTAMGLTIGGGLYPFSSVNYSVTTPVISSIPGSSDLNGVVTSYGKGGLSAAYLGASWKPFEELAIGMEAMGLFGSISRVAQTQIYSQSYLSLNQRTDRMSGSGLRLGASWSLGAGFTVAGTAALYSSLDIIQNYRQSTLNSSNLAYDTVFSTNATAALPSAYGLGMSYQTGRWLLAADFNIQDFSSFDYAPGKAEFRRQRKASIGLARLASYKLGLPFEDRVQISAGLGWQELYYAVNQIGIEEYYAAFGLQIPVAGSAMADLAVQAGIRGTEQIVRENFLRFTISLSIGEVWFKPFPRE
jgi:hypothetical protein